MRENALLLKMGAVCCVSTDPDDGQRLKDVQDAPAPPPPIPPEKSVRITEADDNDDDDEFWDGNADSDEDEDDDVVWVELPGEKAYLARLEAEARNGQCLVRYHADGCVQLVDYFKLSRTAEEGNTTARGRQRLSQGGKNHEDVWVEWEGEWFAASVECLAGEGQVLVRRDNEEAVIVEAEYVRKASRKESTEVRSFTKTFHKSKSNALSEAVRDAWMRKTRNGITRAVWEQAPKAVRGDHELVMSALASAKTGFDAAIIFKHASDKLRGDKVVAVAALRAAGENAAQGVFGSMTDRLRTDRAIVLAALEAAKPTHAGSILQQAPAVRRSDFHVALAAVKRDGSVLHTVAGAMDSAGNTEQLEALRQEVRGDNKGS